MLFDLRGRRKRVIQVIYVMLALLMGFGLIGLGIGGDANGGILDALGLGGNSSTPANPTFERQIDRANETLAANPDDEKALLTLARYEFLAAQDARGEPDELGQRAPTAESVQGYQDSVDAWERYLATKPAKPDDDVASLVLQAYENSIDPSSPLLDKQLAKLVATAQIVAEARPSFGAFQTLTAYSYIAGDEKTGAEAAKRARAEAADSDQRKAIDQLVKQAKQQRDALLAQSKAGANGSNELPDPTAGLGGSSPLLPAPGGVSGAPTPAP